MRREEELARAAVEAYGQPDFVTCMIEFNGATGENVQANMHLLRDAGLQGAMIKHAQVLKSQGQRDASRSILREVGIRFGNPTKGQGKRLSSKRKRFT